MIPETYAARIVVRCWRMRVACLLMFVIISSKIVDGFTMNDPKNEIEFEPVDQYRRRMGIEYAYNTTILNPEICRYYNETACEEMEKNFKDHAEARRKLQLSESPGVMKVIVLRIWFLDHADYFDADPLGGGRYFFTDEDFDLFFNGPVKISDPDITPTGSIKTYIEENSYNKSSIDAYIAPWTPVVGFTEADCAGPAGTQGRWDDIQKCWSQGLDALEVLHNDPNDEFSWYDYDKDFDGRIDSLIIMHSGYASERGVTDEYGANKLVRIQSHAKSSLSSSSWKSPSAFYPIAAGNHIITSAFRGVKQRKLARINIILHEYLHIFGVPDLFDVSFQTYGVGGFCLMAYPYGHTGSMAGSTTPGIVSPWTKIQLGWLDPIEITENGTYEATPSLTTEKVYKISSLYPSGEYLLIENRQPLKWDSELKGGGGIVIWSIDDTIDGNSAFGQQVVVMQADGLFDLENKNNFGDKRDFWVAGCNSGNCELGPTGTQSTRSRRTGALTGLRLLNFSATGEQMFFSVEGFEDEPSSSPVLSPTPFDTYYCGTDWSDAATNCHTHCPDGTDGECAPGQNCFAGTSCNGSPSSSDSTQPSSIIALTPQPTPISPRVSARGDSRMIAFLGNWQSCPSPKQYDQYTHIVISFAVSYTWREVKNQCSTSCTIGASVPICENRENQDLMDVWHAAGKKIILSFGGAGMGGSWAGDKNDCWNFCFGEEASVVSQLGTIVEAQGFDGVDIDYEYFHSTIEQQHFLREVTIGLRNTLPEGSIVSHAPMDSDLVPGQGYYNIMKEVAWSMDFVMPQYYNGVTRPAIDGLDGSGSGQMSALSHYQTLVNDMFDGAAEKVIFGFCISDCSSTGSNADAQQAAAVMTALNEAYPCNGGAFFWVAEHDSSGSWSSTVGDVLFRNGGCSDGTSPPSGPGPSVQPSLLLMPSSGPSAAPSESSLQSKEPSTEPSSAGHSMSSGPTELAAPSALPSSQPSVAPITFPSLSREPSQSPSAEPSDSGAPSFSPSSPPFESNAPSGIPSLGPNESSAPSTISREPSQSPSAEPSDSGAPSFSSSSPPSEPNAPSGIPSLGPNELSASSTIPSSMPSRSPVPSGSPSSLPSLSQHPTPSSSFSPTGMPSAEPSSQPNPTVIDGSTQPPGEEPNTPSPTSVDESTQAPVQGSTTPSPTAVDGSTQSPIQSPVQGSTNTPSPTAVDGSTQSPGQGSITASPTAIDGSTQSPVQGSGSPVTAPTATLTKAPVPDTQECIVGVSTDECVSLMVNHESITNCDCFNFCNGNELSCCAFGEPCSITCSGELVAGCIEPDPEPESVCLVSVSTGQCSYSVQKQTPVDDCDCYDYCDGEFLGCCGYNEFCPKLCTGNLVAGCQLEEPVSPEPQCLVSIQKGECPPLVAKQTPREECDCYDYCDGEFLGCCGFNEFCPKLCPGRLVAGCELEEALPECLVSISKSKCGKHIKKQQPVENCDCYNYCDGKLVGCCAYGEDCGFKCESGVAVVGCEFESTAPSPNPTPMPRSRQPFFFWPYYSTPDVEGDL